MIIRFKRVGIILGLVVCAIVMVGFITGTSFNQDDKSSVNAGKVDIEDNPASVPINTVGKEQEKQEQDFFAEYRMERERVRGKEIEMLRNIVENHSSESKIREAAALRLVQISEDMEKEMKIENLVKSKGFTDCVVMINDNNANVVLESPTIRLDKEEEIKEQVSKLIKSTKENVTIIVRLI